MTAMLKLVAHEGQARLAHTDAIRVELPRGADVEFFMTIWAQLQLARQGMPMTRRGDMVGLHPAYEYTSHVDAATQDIVFEWRPRHAAAGSA